ncbi:hypothetical protein [Mycetocola miduiensis]|uniref:Uncharacterized protein n=1 Tax=Mycetocola miduiensis TaxID=995034 RepID=A0A1I5CAG6_9MICO|nr:hypothetical protein [Mycetocola miduiensis]SFN83998.1 hypothetical protein SAMN05216219_2313 [Mycetocola miduiensis]
MNSDNELDPVDRLRAADPAGDVQPRAGFADEVIASVTRAVGEAAAEPAPVADLATAGTRRRPRWIPVAAVAASIVVVAAAGYGIGATAGRSTNLADGAAPAISLPAGGSPESMMQSGREPGLGGATDQRMYPYGFGRNSFSASGLGTSAGTAQAYAFDPNTAPVADQAAALAAALEVQSPVELREGGWNAGPLDGSAPTLSISLDGVLSFYYQDPRLNPWLCTDGAEECVPTGEAPSEDAAIAALRALLVGVGRDPEAFEFTSRVWEGSPTRTAEARPVVDGHVIDQPWSLEMAESGIVSANGALADIVGLGQYPVASEQEAFERLSDPRFGGAMTILPAASREPASTPDQWVPPTEPPATPTEGSSLSWPVIDVTIVSARLGLASQWQPDGSVMVVPAYEFTDADGGVWSVVAVADSRLNFAFE